MDELKILEALALDLGIKFSKISLGPKPKKTIGRSSYYEIINNTVGALFLINIKVVNHEKFWLYLSQFKKLKRLSIDGFEIEDFSNIQNLQSLRDLSLKNSEIKKRSVNFSPIGKIKSLKSLTLNFIEIRDIRFCANLTNLTHLDLMWNKIENIKPLSGLTNLTHLSLYNNIIKDIDAVRELFSLKELHISSNKVSDLMPLRGLTKLRSLGLWNNFIQDIQPLEQLKQLRSLYLWGNPIEQLPEWIVDLPVEIKWDQKGSSNAITLYNPTLKYPPASIAEGGKRSIKDYFEQLKKEQGRTEFLFEAKLLVIGEGGTGKTTFTRKIQNIEAEMPVVEDTTLGIAVGKWKYRMSERLNNASNFHVNIWDFGGQKIYQGTHQIFFCDKSFYVLIGDTREEKTDFSYWLNTVEQLGGENSRLVIILNKKFGHEQKFDESGYRSHFGKIIQDVIQIDLKNDVEQLVSLQEKVKYHLSQLPGIGDPLPASWVSIREELLNESDNFISFDKFRNICSRFGIEQPNMIHTLSEYFNRIGAFTHYINEPLLKERIYLNSNWLVKTVYEVIDNEIAKSKRGRLTFDDIKNIWSVNELHYEVDKLTQLMHNFGLMYQIPNSLEYVVPAHLPTVTPYNEWHYKGAWDILHFVYEFDKYMPQGIMSRLIVALNHHIKDHSLVWHRGVNIEANGAYAEIIESYGGINRFEIKIAGQNRIELLAIIRERFAEVLRPFNNLQYKQYVPCICDTCQLSGDPAFHEYNLLLKFKEKGTNSQCYKTGEIVNVDDLLKITQIEDSKMKTIKIFLASSSELQEERKAFREFISVQNDRLHKKGIYLEIIQWEYFIDYMSKDGLQVEYNRAVEESDIFVSLFFTKVGKYTEEEFIKAFGSFNKKNSPRVYTYFKDAPVQSNQIRKTEIASKLKFQTKLRALKHYETIFTNIDNLKNHFRDQLDRILPEFAN